MERVRNLNGLKKRENFLYNCKALLKFMETVLYINV